MDPTTMTLAAGKIVDELFSDGEETVAGGVPGVTGLGSEPGPSGPIDRTIFKTAFSFAEGAQPPEPPAADDLGEIVATTYSLSIEAAGRLNIPVFGNASGSLSRQVVVYEWSRFRDVGQPDGSTQRWGFAIRFCVTVTKAAGEATVSLPVLAAEAQLGRVEAGWTMQVKGISGPKIREAVLAPEELDVETYIKARNSMQEIIAAIGDADTVIKPELLLTVPPDRPLDEYGRQALTTYVVACIGNGRLADWAINKLGNTEPARNIVRAVYEDFGVAQGEAPGAVARAQAEEALRGVRIRGA